jgi:hypothetical protein
VKAIVLLALVAAACGHKQAAPNNDDKIQVFSRWLETLPKPSDALLDSVEHKLAERPCVGRLDTWDRQYTYSLTPQRQLDMSTVKFKLRQAGRFRVAPGRRTGFPEETGGIDDMPIRMAWGKYDVGTQQLHVDFCGDNVPGAPS